MKKFCSLVTVLFVCTMLFARGGLLTGQKNVRCIQTEWFDIIFGEDSERSAAHLALYADSIYDEICAAYEMSPKFRMPVTLLPNSDEFNAFFSNGFYNHIVLIDTTPGEDFVEFSDNLLGTFRHELTHAVSYNTTNKAFRAVQNIFADAVNFSIFSGSGFMAESASVSFESGDGRATASDGSGTVEYVGEGRLNDWFYLHLIRQAKLQGTFPPYQDVTGHRDIFPAGEYYYYGGPFAGFLQKTYGMQKYADWWYACNSIMLRHQGSEGDREQFGNLSVESLLKIVQTI